MSKPILEERKGKEKKIEEENFLKKQQDLNQKEESIKLREI